MKHWLCLIPLGVLLTAPAFAACPLPDAPPETMVPHGYRYPKNGQWQVCTHGEWIAQGKVGGARPYSEDNTGVCLPLGQRFIKKNGTISMSFVPEKTRREFFGRVHECVNGNWWQIPGQKPTASASEASRVPAPGPSDDTAPPSSSPPPVPAPSTVPAPSKDSTGASPPARTSRPLPGSEAPRTMELSEAYQRCEARCREGSEERLHQAEYRCKKEQFDRLGDVPWPPKAVRAYNRCRQLAARRENQRIRACLLPCKQQAGQYIWQGP